MRKKLFVATLCVLFLFVACQPVQNNLTPVPSMLPSDAVSTLTTQPAQRPSQIVQSSETPSPTLQSTVVSKVDGMVGIIVPEGEFRMGSEDFNEDEKPLHMVYLDSFYIDRTEVTNAMFAQFVEQTGYITDAEKIGWSYVFLVGADYWDQINGAYWRYPRDPLTSIDSLPDHPVVQVSWNDAEAYCKWAGRKLPSEAQWEKAARGTDARTYPWGSQAAGADLTNYADLNSGEGWADKTVDDGYKLTAPVGSYPNGASPYGALDMAGNVSEWVADWYGENYYGQSPYENPIGPSSGEVHVWRGGSWGNIINSLRITYRNRGASDFNIDTLGFRCTADVVSPVIYN